MSRKPKRNKTHSAELALTAADSFRNLAHVFLSQIAHKDRRDAAGTAAKDIGGLISSATTLSLAVELYLKALRMLVGLSVTDTHHLWTLYSPLPDPLKKIIEANYERQNKRAGKDSVCIEAILYDGHRSEREIEELFGHVQSDTSLKAVLIRSSNAFIHWRYFHEQREECRPVVAVYEFKRLDLIAFLVKGVAYKLLRDGCIP